jgi:hypothetical protein
VTASEFAFLALGLVLGVAAGAALVEVVRARAPGRNEVRVTVAPNSIPARRSATLADPGPADASPARGGPADRRWVDRDDDDDAGDESDDPAPTPASHSGGQAERPLTAPPPSPNRTDVPDRTRGSLPRPRMEPATAIATGAIEITPEPDPLMEALRERSTASVQSSAARVQAGRVRVATMTAPDRATSAGTGAPRAAAISQDGNGTGGAPARASASGPADAPSDAATEAATDACAEPRRVADERCAVAVRAREGAQEAVDAMRAAQRAYDDHVSQAETEAATADPRAVREAKESAQHAFRAARAGAQTRAEIEAGARDWLTLINDINHRTRAARANAERHRAAAATLTQELERLSVEADAARISAESADEACIAAREAVAVCQEAAAMAAAGVRAAAMPAAPAPPRSTLSFSELELEDEPMASRAGEDASIIRLLRGDREVLTRIVARLGGDDADERRRWQAAIGDLLEALIGRTIEASAFDFPTTHSFWGTFTRAQCRDIAAALASLGYRHDGFGGWADDRVPSQRDLSLATGYAGLDPMRIRHWPSESEMRDLLREVTVAADEYVWEAAGGLTLGERVSLLGRRADALTDLWNEWGIVRPLLLSPD